MAEEDEFSLGSKLIEDGVINTRILKKALEYQELHNTDLKTALRELDDVDDQQIAKFLSETHQVPYSSIEEIEIEEEALQHIPQEVAERHEIFPLTVEEDTLKVAISDPLDFWKIDTIEFESGMDVDVVVVPLQEIREALREYYGDEVDNLAQQVERLSKTVGEGPFEGNQESSRQEFQSDSEGGFRTRHGKKEEELNVPSEEEGKKSPLISLVNTILRKAIRREVSDIHLDPTKDSVVLRYRVDGKLYDVRSFSKKIHPQLVSRIKIMSDLDIAERNIPQDGRFKMDYEDREIDFRVSTVPTTLGEKVVIRILDRERIQLSLNSLGMKERDLSNFRRVLSKGSGIILVTGPTGSGKTTTMYSALNEINKRSANLMTLEDPVEFQLSGINQANINRDRGFTFSNGLRSILRQDPDIIMVGEIRDYETAQIAIQASQTGHLLLSTLHTNSAAQTVNRLGEIGIESFLLADAVQAIIAQRLVRVICPECKITREIEQNLLKKLDLLSNLDWDEITLYEGGGCENCNYTGYDGRTGVFEVLVVTEEIEEAIRTEKPPEQVERQAKKQGMTTLSEHALEKVEKGITTLEEVVGLLNIGIVTTDKKQNSGGRND